MGKPYYFLKQSFDAIFLLIWEDSIASLFSVLLLAFLAGCIGTPEERANANGVIFLRDGYPDLAMPEFNRAVRLNPQFAPAYRNRGTAHEMLQQHDEAIGDFTKAIELNPSDAASYSNRGLVYYAMDDYEQAVRDFNKAIELNPGLSQAFFSRGQAYFQMGEYQKALDDFDKVLAMNSGDAGAHLRRGMTLERMGQTEGAIGSFERFLEIATPAYASQKVYVEQKLERLKSHRDSL
ncbi:MAG TPA: tetratricopeptide repeat protein [Candidatus Brocadiia bacterium]|nr:tetratricopeptide repeat protein [Candidatus Brocadiia bacterium]